MKEIFREKRGITLIALTVTIIILLILAGVSISMTVSENGIIGKAIDAKIRTEVSQIKQKANEEELRGNEFVVEGKYADKLSYDGQGDFSYYPENISDREKKVFESMDICSLIDLYTYGINNNGGDNCVCITGFSEEGIKRLNNGKTKFTMPYKTNKGSMIKAINEYAFEGQSSIVEIKLSENITRIYNGAFAGCTSLIKVEGLENVTDIRGSVFQNCKKLDNVKLGEITSISANCFSGCSSLKNIDIPDTVIAIGEGAFKCCTSLKNLIIPNSVKKMAYEVAYGCTSLEKVVIPSSVQEIGYNCFMNSGTTGSKLYVPFTAEQGEPEGWHAQWNRSKMEIVYTT